MCALHVISSRLVLQIKEPTEANITHTTTIPKTQVRGEMLVMYTDNIAHWCLQQNTMHDQEHWSGGKK